MYDGFYRLQGRPFQLTPDPRFYFESGTHRKALSYLGYGLAQGEGFIVITGQIGSGKTTLAAHVMETIDANRLFAAKLVSTHVGAEDLLRLVAQQFALPSDGVTKAELLQSIEFFLHDQARQGRRTLLIVDEAQTLTEAALEELRMLSNFQLGGHPLLQIFLLGQPEFRDMLRNSPNLEQLRQRVIATHHLSAMVPDEIEPYVIHRLARVGWNSDPQFADGAFEAMFDYSGGIPRKLNILMSRLLLLGAIENLHAFNGDDVRAVVADIEMGNGEPEPDAADEEPAPLELARPLGQSSTTQTGAEDGLAVVDDGDVVHDEPAIVTEPGMAQVPTPALDALQTPIDADLRRRIEQLEARCGEQEQSLRRMMAIVLDFTDTRRGNAG